MQDGVAVAWGGRSVARDSARQARRIVCTSPDQERRCHARKSTGELGGNVGDEERASPEAHQAGLMQIRASCSWAKGGKRRLLAGSRTSRSVTGARSVSGTELSKKGRTEPWGATQRSEKASQIGTAA